MSHPFLYFNVNLRSGPNAGSYVSGVPFTLQLDIVQLNRGGTVPVRLMHRHRSGHYEASWLRWSQRAWMVV